MEHHRRLRNVTRQRDITCYGTTMGRFPRLTPVRLGHQVPDLTMVSFQITLRHAFHSWYSTRFRQGADDKTHCHCPRGPPHSAKHILTECPLFTYHRCLFFSNHSYQWIFSTEQGGHALTQFLHYTQQLLWPLPPRPDPPWLGMYPSAGHWPLFLSLCFNMDFQFHL